MSTLLNTRYTDFGRIYDEAEELHEFTLLPPGLYRLRLEHARATEKWLRPVWRVLDGVHQGAKVQTARWLVVSPDAKTQVQCIEKLVRICTTLGITQAELQRVETSFDFCPLLEGRIAHVHISIKHACGDKYNTAIIAAQED